jgi:hypothetical protein
VNPRRQVFRSAALCTAVLAATGLIGTTLPASAAQRQVGASRNAVAAARQAGRLGSGHQPAVFGDITGVVRGASGAALAGACVKAYGPSGTVRGLTGSAGRYLITGLLPGRYTVSYSACGQSGRYFGQWYGGGVTAAGAARVLVSIGLPTVLRPVTLRSASPAVLIAATRALLRTDGRQHGAAQHGAAQHGAATAARRPFIAGTVRNRSGNGLSGICVTASTSTANSGSAFGVVTRRGGNYSFPASVGKRGGWTVSFATGCGGGNYAPQWWKNAPAASGAFILHARRGSHFAGINARLAIGAIMTGTVRAGSASGPGLPGVCVLVAGIGRMEGVFAEATTQSNGTYRVIGLGTGQYQVQFAPGCGSKGDYLATTLPGAVSATAGKTTAGVNGFLELAAQISGTVTNVAGGTPVAGICVSVMENNGAGGGSATTGVQGGYVVRDLAAGQYSVSFTGGCGSTGSFAPQSYDGQANPQAANPVTATAGQNTSGIGAIMQPGGTVTGALTSFSGGKLSGICVSALSQQDLGGTGRGALGIQLAGQQVVAGTTVSSNGGYRIANLAPGSYEVAFTSGCARSGPAYAAQWFSPQGGSTPTWVTIGAGTATSAVGAKLRLAGSITGVIKNTAGAPLSGICAVPVSMSGQPSAELAEQPAAASKAGRYKITGLAEGNYAVEFEACNGTPYATSWYANANSKASAHLVSVKEGQTSSGINQAMTHGQSVSGRISSGLTGLNVDGFCVAAVDSGGNPVAIALTGNAGYLLTHVAAGIYSLDIFPCTVRTTLLADLTTTGVHVRVVRPLTGVDVTLPAAGSVAGSVLDASAVAVPGICVEATPATGSGMAGLAVTGPTGLYLMTGLAPGTYLIRFTARCVVGTGSFVSQWYSGQPTAALATPVPVTSSTVTGGIGATLAANGGISGMVQVSGVAAAGVCVIAFPSSGDLTPTVAQTAADGTYQLGELIPGNYTVEFAAGCGAASYTTQWYNAAATQSAATPVPVTAGTVTPAIDAN